MDKLIYLASPYTSPFQEVTERRVRQVQDATAKLIEKGYLIFSPIINSHHIADLVSFDPGNYPGAMSPWMQFDIAMIDRADEVWVLCIEGWDQSLGVEAEVQHALKTGKPLRFVEYPTMRLSDTFRAMTLENALAIFEDAMREVEAPQTMYGAGSLYSPASSGLPPEPKIFAPDTRTVYADSRQAEIEAIYARAIKRAYGANEPVPDDFEPCNEPWCSFCIEIKSEIARLDHTDVVEFAPGTGVEVPAPFGAVIEPVLLDTKCLVGCGAQIEVTGVTCGECSQHPDAVFAAPLNSLPDDAESRNSYPMADGLLYYFPNALAEVSKISKAGNDQHNPGQPIHWSRGKSTDHANKIIRHLIDAGRDDEGSIQHAANCAWRALALLQEKIETVRGVPLPRNAWVDTNE